MGAAVGTGEGGGKSVNVELNIVPFIDLMSCLTAFLLVTAVWINIAQINIQPKGKNRDTQQVQQDDETVTLSVLVQSDRIWVGLSRVNEFQEIPKKGDQQDWEKLETTLQHRGRWRIDDTSAGSLSRRHSNDGRRDQGRLHRRWTHRPRRLSREATT